MPVICLRCQQSVEPIKVFEQSPKSNKKWLISRCPKERCAFNIDIEAYVDRGSKKDKEDGGRSFWDGTGWK